MDSLISEHQEKQKAEADNSFGQYLIEMVLNVAREDLARQLLKLAEDPCPFETNPPFSLGAFEDYEEKLIMSIVRVVHQDAVLAAMRIVRERLTLIKH